MITLSRARISLSFLSLAAFGHAQQADVREVSFQPPAIYEQALESQLTDLETAKQLPAAQSKKGEEPDSEMLLNERIIRVEPTGRALVVRHRILRILTDQGAEQLSEHSPTYSPDTTRFHVTQARTIRADGEVIEIEPGAMFIRNPENSSGDKTHSDREEIVIVFPDVAPGAILETTLVAEIFEPRIPNEIQLPDNLAMDA